MCHHIHERIFLRRLVKLGDVIPNSCLKFGFVRLLHQPSFLAHIIGLSIIIVSCLYLVGNPRMIWSSSRHLDP